MRALWFELGIYLWELRLYTRERDQTEIVLLSSNVYSKAENFLLPNNRALTIRV